MRPLPLAGVAILVAACGSDPGPASDPDEVRWFAAQGVSCDTPSWRAAEDGALTLSWLEHRPPSDRPETGSAAIDTGSARGRDDASLARHAPDAEPRALQVPRADGDYDVVLRWDDGAEMELASGEVWNPRRSIDARGRIHVVWDEFDGTSFDVRYARVDDGSVVRRELLAGDPGYAGFPDVATDGLDRAWVTWEAAPQFGEGGPLRGTRRVRLACVDDDSIGHVHALARPELERSDLPRIACTAGGPVLTCRVPGPTFAPRDDPSRARFYASFFTRVVTFAEDGSPVFTDLLEAEGSNEATETLARGLDGRIYCAFAADGRASGFEAAPGFYGPIEGVWRVGVVRLPESRGFPELSDDPIPSRRLAPPRPTPPRVDVRDAAGRLLLYGDLHRHTHLSRCSGAIDGIFEDAVRYARGPGALDFLSVTEHDQHLRHASWWHLRQDVERWNAPPKLAVLHGVERVVRNEGHQNWIYRDAGAAALDPAGVAADDLVAIPHMMGAPDNPYAWSDARAERQRLVEIYQGNRGSFEGSGLPLAANGRLLPRGSAAAALDAGLTPGWIAAADHSSSSEALAGVFADGRDRAEVFEALRARRTFAASARVAVEARLGELRGGEAGGAPADAPFVVTAHPRTDVDGPRPLVAYVEVVKNGETWRRLDGGDDPGAARLFVLTTRNRRNTEGRPIRVSGDGGVVGDASAMTRPNEVLVRSTEAGFETTKDSQSSLVRFAFTPAGDDAALVVEFLHLRTRVPLAFVAPGRSVPLVDLEPELEHLWNLGVPLGRDAGAFEFDDPAREAGDTYYARIAWTDGAIAWTSPVRVSEVAER